MTKILPVIVLLFSLTSCGASNDCDSLSIAISHKYEHQLFIDKDKDRDGFLNLTHKFKAEYQSGENAFKLLTNNSIDLNTKENILSEYGSLLMMMAIMEKDTSKIAFYLSNGINTINYHKHIGVLILDIIDVEDVKIFEIFKTYYEKNKISSEVINAVSGYYAQCIEISD